MCDAVSLMVRAGEKPCMIRLSEKHQEGHYRGLVPPSIMPARDKVNLVVKSKPKRDPLPEPELQQRPHLGLQQNTLAISGAPSN